jgi:DNA repair exonuclease SbcCD ATPase subunit
VSTAEAAFAAATAVERESALGLDVSNPFTPEVSRLQSVVEREAAEVAILSARRTAIETEGEEWRAVDEAFRPSGIVSFVLEGALGALQEATATHLTALAPGVTLELAPCRPSKSDPDAVIERVERIVWVRPPQGGDPKQRSVRQLSGGERRRVALALALGFSQLAGRKGRLRSELLVLDEVMQHLDGEGCARLAGLLRGLPYSSVLVVAQAHSFATRAFDAVDVVCKDGRTGASTVVMGVDTA